MEPAHVDLLVVSPTFYPEPIGTPAYVTDIVRWFAARNFEMAVVTATPFYPHFSRYRGYGRARRRDHFDGVPVRRLPTIIPSGGRSALRALSEANFFFQGVLAQATDPLPRPRAVLSVSPGTPLAVLLGSRLARGARHVALVHDIQSGLVTATSSGSAVVARLSQRWERALLRTSDAVLCLTDQMRQVLWRMGMRGALEVLPLWANLPASTFAGPHRAPEADILYSGNLGRKQDVPLLLDVAERLQSVAPHLTLKIRGDGPARMDLEAAAVARRLDNVSFGGLAPGERLAELLSAPSLHVVPQAPGVCDTVMPSKLFNIMASGRPAVVAAEAASAISALAHASQALALVEPGDAAGMAEAILGLMRDSARRRSMGAAGQRFVAAHHSKDVILRQLAAHLGLDPVDGGPEVQ